MDRFYYKAKRYFLQFKIIDNDNSLMTNNDVQ
jgi:hypothetical protein